MGKKYLRKVLTLLFAILIAGSCMSILPGNAENDTADTLTDVSLTVRIGYDNAITDDEMFVPVFIKATNNTNKIQNGRILISNEISVDGTYVYERYEDISLPPNVTKTITISVWQPELMSKTTSLSFLDQRGNTVCTVTPKNNYFQGTIMCGFVTEDNSAIAKSLYGSISSYFTLNRKHIKVIPITPEYFPTDYDMLSSIGMLIIDECDFSSSSSFSSKQVKMIEDYIESGGTVVFGTGNGTRNTISHFSKYFSASTYSIMSSDVEKKTIRLGIERLRSKSIFKNLYDNEDQDPETELFLCDFNDNFYEPVIHDNDFTDIIFKHNDYNIYVTAFSVTDKNFFRSAELTGSFFSAVAPAGYYQYPKEYVRRVGSLVNDFLTESSFEKSPDYLVIAVIGLVYVFGFIVTVYIILYKKKKTVLFWIALPAASVLTTMIITGYVFYLKGVDHSAVTFSEVRMFENAPNKVSSASRILAAGNGSLKLSYTGNDFRYYNKNTLSAYNNYNKGVAFRSGDDNYAVVPSNGMWTYLNFYGKASDDSYGNFIIDVPNEPREESGKSVWDISVTNNTGKDLSKAYIYCFGNTVCLGDMKKDEKKTVTVRRVSAPYGVDNVEIVYSLVVKNMDHPMSNYASEIVRILEADYYNQDRLDYEPKLSNGEKIPEDAYLLLYSSEIISNAILQEGGDIYVCGFDYDGNNKLEINGRTRKERSVSMLWQSKTVKINFEDQDGRIFLDNVSSHIDASYIGNLSYGGNYRCLKTDKDNNIYAAWYVFRNTTV